MPTTEEASVQVSDSGDILSAKNAPETMAPAAIATLASKALLIPINATPIVAAVVKLLPSATPIIEVSTKAEI